MNTIINKPDPLQGTTREWPSTPYSRAIKQIFGPEPEPEHACLIAYLGGCTVQGGTACGARIGHLQNLSTETQFHLAVRLHHAFPGQSYVIRNFAEAGYTAGYFMEKCGMRTIRKSLPHVHAAFLRYGIADRKKEGIAKTMENLAALCSQLQETFEGITIIMETDMWVDHPGHYMWDRNPHLCPLYEQVRTFAKDRGYQLIDIFSKVEQETQRGNWDLRQRVVPVEGLYRIEDASFDTIFGDDPAFYTDIHPNSRCLRLIADWEVAKLKELFGERLPNNQ